MSLSSMVSRLLKNTKLLLILIILLAGFLRFYQLGSIPPSLTWDEVAWGYNAYALGIDGKDEFGKFLPYDYFESFGDFKPPVYAYLTVIPVMLFGLNEFATRFPSALLGTLTVLVTFFLTRRIFNQKQTVLPLVAAGLLAISPWHILLSRGAFEANVSSFFLITGVWLFLEAVYKRKWLLVLSAISFVAAFYTFNTARIVGPILVLGLVIGFWKQLFVSKKQVLVSFIVGVLLMLPIVGFLLTPYAQLRFTEVNIFSDISVIETSNQQIANDNNAIWSKVIHNRRVGYSLEFFKHYFDNLSPQFLFIIGDGNPKFSIQTLGQMYLWELPFFIAGILFLFRRREGHWWIIPFWLLISIIPAATARETPHALRIEAALPTFQILIAYGIVNVLLLTKKTFRKIPLQKAAVSIVSLMAFIGVVYFSEQYFVHYRNQFSDVWQYGYKDAIDYATSVENKYDKIYLADAFGRPYIYVLFYKQYDPQVFRKNAEITRESYGFVHVNNVGKFHFREKLLKDESSKNILYIDKPKAVPPGVTIIKTFKQLNGEEVLKAYTY